MTDARPATSRGRPFRRRGVLATVCAAVAALPMLAVGGATEAQTTEPSPLFVNDDIVAVASGYEPSCIIGGADSALYCFGYNDDDGVFTPDYSSYSEIWTPVRMADDVDAGFVNGGFDDVEVGWYFACGLQDGTVFCWGENGYGQIGDGTTDSALTPTEPVPGGGFTNTSVTQLATGGYHTCAVEGGSVYCWGYNSDGELGNGTSDDSLTPVKANAAGGFANTAVTAITAGEYHTCAIEGGVAYCWGYDRYGRVGNGSASSADVLEPTPVEAVGDFANAGVTAITASEYHTCAVEAGEVFCWGYNGSGALGDGTTTDRVSPVKVSSAGDFVNAGVTAVSSRLSETTCAVQAGELFCWGANDSGKVGDGTTTDVSTPQKVGAARGFLNTSVSHVDAGAYVTCAVESGQAFCWGDNSYGQVGAGHADQNPVDHLPRRVASFSPTFDNGLLRVGELLSDSCSSLDSSCDDGHPDTAWRALPSVVADGRLASPYYWSTSREAWMQLVYDQNPMDLAIGVGTGGTTMWNGNTDVLSSDAIDEWTALGDDSTWSVTSATPVDPYTTYGTFEDYTMVDGLRSVGIGKFTGSETQVGDATLGVDFRYSMPADLPIIKVELTATNTGASTAENVHVWAGTGDDYIAGSDSNGKARGLIDGSGFTPMTAETDPNNAILVTSDADAVVFYSPDSDVKALFDSWGSFGESIVQLDPATSGTEEGCSDPFACDGDPSDGAYAIVRDLGDIAPGESATFTYLYGAVDIDALDDLLAGLDLASRPVVPAGVEATAGDGEVTVSWAAVAGAIAYEVTGVPGGSCEVDAPTTTCTITGLTNGTEYSFTVVAIFGDGSESATSTAVTATPVAGAATTSTTTVPSSGIGPIPANAGLGAGASLATLDGASQPVTLSRVANELRMNGSGFAMSLAGLGVDGGEAPLDQDGNVVLTNGGLARVSGNGFAPGSEIEIYLFSSPVLLGTTTADANGSFSVTVPIPASTPAGEHTLQANGVTGDGAVRSLNLGVVVPQATLPATGSGTVVALWAVLLGAVGFALLGMARRRVH